MSRNQLSRPDDVLAHSQLQVSIVDLVAEYTLRHEFRNASDTGIEAVYSFPIPLDAVFLGMEAVLAGEKLQAQVIAKQQAILAYDDAIADGDSAVLLEQVEPGMLCVNLGNLLPGETGEITLRFAAQLRTADRTARFSLPLVHRPRYGRSTLEEWVKPSNDFAVEHPLSARVRIEGLLSRSAVHCPTHPLRFEQGKEFLDLTLDQAMLDRDFVLVFDLPSQFASQGRLVRDGDDAIGVVTVTTPLPDEPGAAFDLCLIMDCSGSMTGDAIRQSRQAMTAVAKTLGAQDRIQILSFGSQVTPLFRRGLKASARVCEAMIELAGGLEANMGGTQMGDALERAISELSPGIGKGNRNPVIVLVTDGAVEIEEIKDVQDRALSVGIRIFMVAVGSSAGSDVLEPLADSTLGVLERAVPGEPVDVCVMRQVRRARQPAPRRLAVDWGVQAKPLPMSAAYAGDGFTAMALLTAREAVTATVSFEGQEAALRVPLESMGDGAALMALAGQRAYRCAPDEQRAALAQRYGLITSDTSAVLVKVRNEDEKASGLPRIVPVVHMEPLRFGGSMDACAMVFSADAYAHRASTKRSIGKMPVACMAREPVAPVRNGRVKVVPYKTDEAGRPIVPKGYRPDPNEEYMSALQVEYFRQRLLAWRAVLVEESKQSLKNLGEEVLGVDNDVGGASHKTDDERVLTIRERYRKLIGKIDRTLKRLDSGDYGYSIESGEEIGLERLEARLTAERTIDEQASWEQRQRQIRD